MANGEGGFNKNYSGSCERCSERGFTVPFLVSLRSGRQSMRARGQGVVIGDTVISMKCARAVFSRGLQWQTGGSWNDTGANRFVVPAIFLHVVRDRGTRVLKRDLPPFVQSRGVD